MKEKQNNFKKVRPKHMIIGAICFSLVLISALGYQMIDSKASGTTDEKVLEAQVWLNDTYTGKTGYTAITEDGIMGAQTIKGLIIGLQTELGIETPNGVFGPTTLRLCPTLSTSYTDNTNIIKILQYGLFCKGYSPTAATGNFVDNTKAAVKSLQSDAGLTQTGQVIPLLMKSILTTDSYKLGTDGDSVIRTIQQKLNGSYGDTIGIIACDGNYTKATNKALISGVQIEEGSDISSVDGIFGTGTMSLFPELTQSDSNSELTKIMEYALYLNGSDLTVFDGVYDSAMTELVSDFQVLMKISVTGTITSATAKSLLVSCGDTTRSVAACDTATILTSETAALLSQKGYTHVGRYLTGTINGTVSKAMTAQEAQIIFGAGMKFFPIYQTSANYVSYFTVAQAKTDVDAAVTAARNLGIPVGTTIYFAVDFDESQTQITANILPYFQAVKARMTELGSPYGIGAYGSREVCSSTINAGYATTCFVSDMSGSHQGNYAPMPANWAFDQIVTATESNDSVSMEIDRDGMSGVDNGVGELNTTDMTVTLNFYPNGGTVTTTSKTVTRGALCGTLPVPTRTGYTFKGWYTSATSSTRITAGSKVSTTAAAVNLYAQWTANTYTVTFNPYGGTTSTTSKSVIYAATYGTLPSPKRAGYAFCGWYTATGGGSKIISTSKVTITKAQTLYARWSKVTVGTAAIKTLSNSSTLTAKVTWGTVSGAKGYMVTYAQNSGFTTKKVSVYTTSTSYSATKLTKGKTYYVKVRAYKIDSTGAKVFGSYSGVKTIKITK